MSSIFSRIAAHEIPANIVAENDDFMAFLDINPLAKGHTLVIPKKEVDYIFDLDDDLYRAMFDFARKIAKAIDKFSDAKRIGIAVIGLEVAHAHIHLVPINALRDIDFTQPKLSFSSSEMQDIASKIASYLD